MAWIPKPKFDEGAVYVARRPFTLSGQPISPGDEIRIGESLSARTLKTLFEADHVKLGYVPQPGSTVSSSPSPSSPSASRSLNAAQALKSAINKKR